MLEYKDNELTIDGLKLKYIAQTHKTPLYVYSMNQIKKNINKIKEVFEGLPLKIVFAVKANNNIQLLKRLKDLGVGADVVTIGEIEAAKRAGISYSDIVINGNAKTEEEIEYAIKNDFFMINIDSADEYEIVENIAKNLNKKPNISFRLNPDVDPKTHPHISTGLKKNKFGINLEVGYLLIKEAHKSPYVNLKGIHTHIGSQILQVSPFYDAFLKVKELLRKLEKRNIQIEYYNIGGGWGIDYHKNGEGLNLNEYREKVIPLLKSMNVKIIFEPGRFLVGNAGILVGKVLLTKTNEGKKFIFVDIGMNDLIRPSLYDAYHHILPVEDKNAPKIIADIMGQLCESGDKVAQEREVPEMEKDDYMVVCDTGAYGYSMASNYNSRPKPKELLIENGKIITIRERESIDHMFSLIPD